MIGSRHLVCGNCASWIQHESSGCEKKWADTRVEGFVFTCKGCTEVAALAKEVEGLRQMVEDMKEMVAGLRFEDKGAETGSRVTATGVNQDREEAAGKIRTEEMVTGVDDEGEIRTEEMITGVEDEGEIRTEERKEICTGETLMATHAYTRNPESPLGKEIDLHQWDTLIFKGTLEASRRQKWTSMIRTSGVPDGHPRHDSRGGGKQCYQEGTREQYRGKPDWRMDSAAVIDGRSSLFTGSKNRACDGESRDDHGKRKWRVHTGTRRDEQHGQGRNNSDS